MTVTNYNSASNVSVGKPKIGGAIFRAPFGSTLPTSASATLDAAFKPLGYISEDGVTNTYTLASENYKSWDGDTVESGETERTDAYQFKLIEALNPEVLKAVYGDDNVTVASATGDITLKVNSTPQEPCAWVIDVVLKGGAIKRTVIPNAKVTAVGEIVYRTNELIGYETTITAYPDTDGDTHKEYIEV